MSDMSGSNKVPTEVENVDITVNQRKRRRYQRHSPQQVQAMEEFFREYPHPDKRQRIELGQDLGIDPLQVKFWFQNKRTQMKTKHQNQDNARLMAENEKLKAINAGYKEALRNTCCNVCGSISATENGMLDEKQLVLRNAELREEIDRISVIAANYVRRPFGIPLETPSTSKGKDGGKDGDSQV